LAAALFAASSDCARPSAGDGRGQVGELLRLNRQQLVAGLGRLQCAGSRLARRDQALHRAPRTFDVG
jgi:hypothetical protein